MHVSYIGTDIVAANYGCRFLTNRFHTRTSKVYLCGASCYCVTRRYSLLIKTSSSDIFCKMYFFVFLKMFIFIELMLYVILYVFQTWNTFHCG